MDLVFSRTKKIPNKNFGRECSLCSSRHGVPIECSARGCKASYHTSCAIRGKLKMQAIFGKIYKGGIKLKSYCKEHSPAIDLDNGETSQSDKIDASGVREVDMTNLADEKAQKGSEELDFFWKYVDINEVHKKISNLYSKAKKKDMFDPNLGKDHLTTQEVDPLLIDLIYRYWMLLRTANNGQSLIKFSPSALREREFEQRKSIMKLRIELERVRNLSYMIGKREKLKASWLKTHQNIIKRTLNIINELQPASDAVSGPTNGLQPQNGMFNESDQLINDLITCDQIYEFPNISTNSNYGNLSYQDRSTLERRRTLSLVRRINRQLKTGSTDTSLNPYAKSYLALKRSDSPMSAQQADIKCIR